MTDEAFYLNLLSIDKFI